MHEPLSIGNKVELVPIVASKANPDEKIIYLSQILDITDEGIVCAMPISEGRLIPIEVGTGLESFFYTAKGIYKVDCDVYERKKDGGLYTMTLSLRDTPKKFQRREFFRLEHTMEIAVKKLNEDEEMYFHNKKVLPDTITGEEVRYISIDISGGGMRMLSYQQFEKGNILELQFQIEIAGKKKDKRLAGQIVTSSLSKNNSSVYDNRIQFKHIKKEDSEDIVKFIFEQQRIMRKKELG